METAIPTPKFNHFERVLIVSDGEQCRDVHGEQGTILWLDSSAVRRKLVLQDHWLYVVYLSTQAAYRSFFQSELESLGDFDPESAHHGVHPEISFDLTMEEHNDWMEGSYRLPGEIWKVVTFKKDDVSELLVQPSHWKRPTQWERDITGIEIRFPRRVRMGYNDLLHAMSMQFGVTDWVQVQGPDSMMLR